MDTSRWLAQWKVAVAGFVFVGVLAADTSPGCAQDPDSVVVLSGWSGLNCNPSGDGDGWVQHFDGTITTVSVDADGSMSVYHFNPWDELGCHDVGMQYVPGTGGTSESWAELYQDCTRGISHVDVTTSVPSMRHLRDLYEQGGLVRDECGPV